MKNAWRDIRGREMERPWCCPEPRCQFLLQVADSTASVLSEPQPGQSWSCFGRLGQSATFEYDGIDHRNDLKSCHYTALKGVVSWQENRDDWALMADAYDLAVKRLDVEEAR